MCVCLTQVENLVVPKGEKIKKWTYSSNDVKRKSDFKTNQNKQFTYEGLELFFNEQDAGSFGIYSCSVDNSGMSGNSFSILVEGIQSQVMNKNYM